MQEAQTLCDIFADKVKEAQRQQALENEYTKTIRELCLKVGEMDEALKKVNARKTQKNIDEYMQIYDDVMKITEKQNKLYYEISQYREITPEQENKGFL